MNNRICLSLLSPCAVDTFLFVSPPSFPGKLWHPLSHPLLQTSGCCRRQTWNLSTCRTSLRHFEQADRDTLERMPGKGPSVWPLSTMVPLYCGRNQIGWNDNENRFFCWRHTTTARNQDCVISDSSWSHGEGNQTTLRLCEIWIKVALQNHELLEHLQVYVMLCYTVCVWKKGCV